MFCSNEGLKLLSSLGNCKLFLPASNVAVIDNNYTTITCYYYYWKKMLLITQQKKHKLLS